MVRLSVELFKLMFRKELQECTIENLVTVGACFSIPKGVGSDPLRAGFLNVAVSFLSLNKISVDIVENRNARGSMNRLRLTSVHLVQDTNSAMCENAHGCDINRLRTKLVRLGLFRQDTKYPPLPLSSTVRRPSWA